MSTVISYNSDSFKILMCDTRVMRKNNEGKLYIGDDNALKIHYLDNWGFVTGVGSELLINAVFNELLRCKIANTSADYLVWAFDKIYKEVCSTFGEKDVPIEIEKTVITIAATESVYLFSKEFQKKLGNYGVTLKLNEINVLYPLDMNEDQQRIPELAGSFFSKTQVLTKMIEQFLEISSSSNYVSERCCLSILEKGENTPFFIKKDARILLDDINNNGLDTLVNQFGEYEEELKKRWDG